MGTGIMGVIPLSIKNVENVDKYFNKGFFENYNQITVDDYDIFEIKKDILLKNYTKFIYEFYNLIEEKISDDGSFLPPDEEAEEEEEVIEKEEENLENIENYDEFLEKFSSDERNTILPCVDDICFFTLGCDSLEHFSFYLGSYKAMLEEYGTLLHFEKVLAKAMENPLAKSIKIGIFG
jgi:hypothetical protein